jgi:general secretion pathway protein G
MELLLVMAILVILAGIGTTAYLNYMRNARSDAALLKINELEMACKAYKLQVGRFPASLDHLFSAPPNVSVRQWRGPYVEEPIPPDPWGGSYAYSADEGNNRVFIRSAGPDGQMNTADDVPDPAGQSG